MTDHYLDIRLLPDPEFSTPLLMSALFSKLHRALVQQGEGNIGVSFPKVRPKAPSLDDCLRLHGSAEALGRLASLNWLLGMRDHTAVGEITPVPGDTAHRVVRRVQAKSSPERLRRRLMQRRGITLDAACEAIPDTAGERLNLPFVTLRSQSTGQPFRLFIEHLPVQEQPVRGEFSAYGLSPEATVPWF